MLGLLSPERSGEKKFMSFLCATIEEGRAWEDGKWGTGKKEKREGGGGGTGNKGEIQSTPGTTPCTGYTEQRKIVCLKRGVERKASSKIQEKERVEWNEQVSEE